MWKVKENVNECELKIFAENSWKPLERIDIYSWYMLRWIFFYFLISTSNFILCALYGCYQVLSIDDEGDQNQCKFNEFTKLQVIWGTKNY